MFADFCPPCMLLKDHLGSEMFSISVAVLYITLLNIKAKKGGFCSKATEEPLWVSKRTS